jgi:hypothetical protein
MEYEEIPFFLYDEKWYKCSFISDIEIKDDIFKSGEYLDDSENYSAVDSSGKFKVF